MAVVVTSGELKHKVVFKQPTSSLNDRGEKEKTFTTAFTTWAKVDRFNQFRTSEANAQVLIDALDFFIRHSASREAIDKDWLIEYRGDDYTIHNIERVEQKENFIRFTAKVRNDG